MSADGFSASRAGLLTKCRYSFRTDVRAQIASLPERPPSVEAQCGRALHRMGEWRINAMPGTLRDACVEFGVLEKLPELAEKWAHMERWIERRRIYFPLEAEVKLALDLKNRSARELLAKGDRNYTEAKPGEIPMTLDVLSLTDDSIPRFYDWKTGRSGDGYSGQIGLNALAVADWLATCRPFYWSQWQAVEGGVLHVTPDGIDETRVHVFTKYDLAAIADDLGSDLASIEGSSPTKGDHCLEMYCKAFGVCPETAASVGHVSGLVPETALVRHRDYNLSIAIQSPDHAAWCLETLKTYKHFAEEVKDAIAAYVGTQEHLLADGSRLKATTRNARRNSWPDLVQIALAHGATNEEISACSYPVEENAGIRIVGKKKKAA